MTEILDPRASPPLDTPWIPMWPLAPQRLGELAYAEFTSDVSVPDATTVDVVSSGEVTYTGVAIVIDCFSPRIIPAAVTNGTLQLHLWDGATNLGILGQVTTGGAWNTQVPFLCQRRLVPTPGPHSYRIRATSTGGTSQVAGRGGGAGQFMPGFIRISLASPLLSAPPGAAVPVQYGTSLPSNPLDGQEAILVDSLTNPTYQWRFRYNAGSSSAYKWEFVGGPGLYVQGADVGVSSATWATLVTGPSAPRSGEYQIQYGVKTYLASGVSQSFAARPVVGATAPSGFDESGIVLTLTTVNLHTGNHMSVEKMAATAGDQIRHMAAMGAAGSTVLVREPWLLITPLRVS